MSKGPKPQKQPPIIMSPGYHRDRPLDEEYMKAMTVATLTGDESKAVFYKHLIKCLGCSLHFVVCSLYPDWPRRGTTRDLKLGEATGLIFCPECGVCRRYIHWRKKVNALIKSHVPGEGAEMIEFRDRDAGKAIDSAHRASEEKPVSAPVFDADVEVAVSEAALDCRNWMRHPIPERPDAVAYEGTAREWKFVVSRFSIEDQGFPVGSVGYDGAVTNLKKGEVTRLRRQFAENVFKLAVGATTKED